MIEFYRLLVFRSKKLNQKLKRSVVLSRKIKFMRNVNSSIFIFMLRVVECENHFALRKTSR